MTEEKKAAAKQNVVETAAPETVSNLPTGRQERLSEDYFADFDFSQLTIDMNAMLKAGVHFGHQKSRRNPKMDEYIFGTRNGVNILDLQKTVAKLNEAAKFIEKIVSEGQEILFVGTKKQAKKLVEKSASKKVVRKSKTEKKAAVKEKKEAKKK